MNRTILLASALALLGCGPSLSTARTAVDATAAVYQATKAPLEQRYEDEQMTCLEQRPSPPDPCVAAVRTAWKPVRDAEVAFYRALVLAQDVVGMAEAAAATGKKPDVAQVMVVVTDAVAAGEKLRDAIRDLQKSSEPPAKPKASPWVPWTGPAVPKGGEQ